MILTIKLEFFKNINSQLFANMDFSQLPRNSYATHSEIPKIDLAKIDNLPYYIESTEQMLIQIIFFCKKIFWIL